MNSFSSFVSRVVLSNFKFCPQTITSQIQYVYKHYMIFFFFDLFCSINHTGTCHLDSTASHLPLSLLLSNNADNAISNSLFKKIINFNTLFFFIYFFLLLKCLKYLFTFKYLCDGGFHHCFYCVLTVLVHFLFSFNIYVGFAGVYFLFQHSGQGLKGDYVTVCFGFIHPFYCVNLCWI